MTPTGKQHHAETATLSREETPGTGQSSAEVLQEHIVEIVSDSGEGAQRCGQSLAAIAARSGNGIWTVEIIPAEIQPPHRSVAGASGNRVRIASHRVTNVGDEADLVVAFNEQVLLSRLRAGEVKPGATILLENMWAAYPDPDIRAAYAKVRDEVKAAGYRLYEVPLEVECQKYVPDPRRGKNMFVLGMLCAIYSLDPELARAQVRFTFAKKEQKIVDANVELLDAGRAWAEQNLDLRYAIPAPPVTEPQVVMNGNAALALGVVASGMEVCAMYPITPATSASHYLSNIFEKVGCVVHQAEDEIAACTFAIGASYAGKCAVTITSGPGLSLKQEGIGLAVMAEIPLVVIDVQRGGPSTGLPTKVEQGDLMAAMFGGHGDAPKVVMAASSIEDCFYSVITARKIAETFNMVVVILTDAALATAQQPYPRPKFNADWLAPPVNQSAVPEDAHPYDWDERTGIATRFIPGQPNGMHCLTGLAHDRDSHVAYDPEINEEGLLNRSRKLAALQTTLRLAPVFGDEEGDLLLIGWGSTRGAIEEAVSMLRAEGHKVSSLHLKFLQPMASGIDAVMKRFGKVMTIENNWNDPPSDPLITPDNRRYSHLAQLLRSRWLIDVDCWGKARGQPLKPAAIVQAARAKLAQAQGEDQ
ncbi:2-oxoacid:acceptor oxidoreductase subunit alpha [Tropicimonas isoalkanivorans]|uniref:2-oxoglutarate ferredoxin oxidoreductase subunit alpha n=1 Tax=Tropicimonas isoalkanivorans TaxID=441112 RepID=A0A1I1QYX5_9RHOB|nr:2-oxoacid:acceptor oxidoreductase subunit alpha [Tropicimonas isoalkanivorans]SFD27316.1 2-oxoglutarate ferredoxin oxidoreductase subunit alpha [Tropicimonas isoalkanivorans]